MNDIAQQSGGAPPSEMWDDRTRLAIDPDVDGFSVQIASTGATFYVAPHDSIVEVLADAGIQVETSCTSGLCATCKLRYLAGAVDHRDFILSDEERADHLTVCVSRAKSALLVLDL